MENLEFMVWTAQTSSITGEGSIQWNWLSPQGYLSLFSFSLADVIKTGDEPITW